MEQMAFTESTRKIYPDTICPQKDTICPQKNTICPLPS